MLKSAKLRSTDPSKYLPLAVNMLTDRLKQSDATYRRKRSVRFAHILETLFIATNNEPALVASMLEKTSEEKKLFIFSEHPKKSSTIAANVSQETMKEIKKMVDNSLIESVIDRNTSLNSSTVPPVNEDRQIVPMMNKVVESTISSNVRSDIESKFRSKI